MRVLSAMLGLALAACGQPSRPTVSLPTAAAPTTEHYVRVPAAALTPDLVRATRFNRDHVHRDAFAFGYVDHDGLRRLADTLGDQVVELDATAIARGTLDPLTLGIVERDERPGAYEGYHHYDDLTAELRRLAAAHPDRVALHTAGKSIQGRELWYLKISDDVAVDDASEPKLLYIGNMHGDETVGRELLIYLARRLADDYGSDARVTNLVDHAQIFVMPSMNPDGFELGRRGNARGVDLNRDFPDFTSDPYDTPAGRAPETAAVMALHAQHHFVAALNFHGGEVCFNLPWDTRANARVADRFGDDPRMQQLARQYADANVTMRGNSGGSFNRGVTYGYEWYQIDGGMQDWSIHFRNSTHATVELSTTKYPSAANLARYWHENEEAMLKYLEDATFGVHLRVVDAAGRPVAQPSVKVQTLAREQTFAGPYVHRAALAGEQTVRVSAPGFAPIEVTLAPAAFDGSFTEVVLPP